MVPQVSLRMGVRDGLRDITNNITNIETDESGDATKAVVAVPANKPHWSRPSTDTAMFTPQHLHADPQACVEYEAEIYKFLHAKEQSADMRISRGFLSNHQEVTPRMRAILLDWLIEVHYKFKLTPETLYLCINMIDRYLLRDRNIPKKRLQLMGGTCMLIASKYEEYRPPEVRDICYIMDNAYQKSDVLEMEVQILNTLGFGLTTASPLQFLEFFARSLCERDSELNLLAQFCLECCLIDCDMTCYLPSQLACVALYVASRIMYPEVESHRIPGPYDEHHMRTLEDELLKVISVQKDKALGKKYAKERYKNVMQYIRKYE